MQADYLALDRHVGNRINLYREVRIRRTQLDTAARFREITLDRHFPLHQRDHDITGRGFEAPCPQITMSPS